jgi:hypothetical protein
MFVVRATHSPRSMKLGASSLVKSMEGGITTYPTYSEAVHEAHRLNLKSVSPNLSYEVEEVPLD